MKSECKHAALCGIQKNDDEFIGSLVKRILETYSDNVAVNHNEGRNLPRESEILDVLNQLLELVFPGFAEREAYSRNTLQYAVGEIVATVYVDLKELVLRAFRFHCQLNQNSTPCDCGRIADEATTYLLSQIPEIRESMKLDMRAAFDGDPAATSHDEVVLSYPGLKAITIQRIAHALYEKRVPLIPRMMGEYAHRITGIDIHPGAKLGKGVFIDHGTGVVIGETASIGDGVKIYQGVTLGALSFPKDACGMIIRGAIRHPTIEDHVTIYAGATILGAVTIGKGSVIGGNVWLTEGTEPGTKVTIAQPELDISKTSKGGIGI